MHFVWIFFFQAEDGIRDLYVTGVQTCALPICTMESSLGFASSGTASRMPLRWEICRPPSLQRQQLGASVAFCMASSCRSEEHTSELQSRRDLVCRLLLEKKKRVYGNCRN